MFGYIFLVGLAVWILNCCISNGFNSVKVFSTLCGLKNEVHTLVFNNKNM